MSESQAERPSSTDPKNPLHDRGRRVEKAYRYLRDLIVHGQLAPGTRIVEGDVASRLGVSRTPVRDALRLLQQEGYVLGQSPGGYKSRLVIAPLTKEDACELYSIIGRLEGLAARHAARVEPVSRSQLTAKLRSLNQGLRELAQADHKDPNRIFELDTSLHRELVEAGAGRRLFAIYGAITPQAERYWRLYVTAVVERLAASVAEHDEIIHTIDQGDAELAERAVERNWSNGAEWLCGVIDKLGERGSW